MYCYALNCLISIATNHGLFYKTYLLLQILSRLLWTHLLTELLLLHLLLHRHLLVLLHWVHHGPALAPVPSDASTRHPSGAITCPI